MLLSGDLPIADRTARTPIGTVYPVEEKCFTFPGSNTSVLSDLKLRAAIPGLTLAISPLLSHIQDHPPKVGVATQPGATHIYDGHSRPDTRTLSPCLRFQREDRQRHSQPLQEQIPRDSFGGIRRVPATPQHHNKTIPNNHKVGSNPQHHQQPTCRHLGLV